MKKDPLVRATLGDHILNHSVEAKLAVWQEYSATVHPWEVERYLARY
jgi:glutamine synthetase